MTGRSLLGRRDRHDPEQNGQVPEAEGVDRDDRLPVGRRRRERPLRLVLVAEVGPPQAGAQHEAQQREDDQLEVDRQSLGRDSDGDDRLPDRDDHDEPVPLDEVGCADQEARGRDQARCAPLQRHRDRPEYVLSGAAGDPARQHHGGRYEVHWSQPHQVPQGRLL